MTLPSARERDTTVLPIATPSETERKRGSGVFLRAVAPRRLAALDLRSNSVHLVVADVGERGFGLVAQAKEKIQLAQTVFVDGRLTDETMSKGVDAVRRLLALAVKALPDRIVVVASPAFRHAANGEAFVRRIEMQLGVRVHVLDGDEHARLLLAGVRASLPAEAGPVAVFDLGGGSAEIALADGSELLLSESLPLGTLRLRGALGTRSLPDAEGLAEVERFATRCLTPVVWRMRKAGARRLIVSCGVARRLWRLAEPTRKRGVSLPPRGEARLSVTDLDRLIFRLKGMTEKGRTFAIGAAAGSDTLLTGALVLRVLARVLGVDEVAVCTTGMREGIVIEARRGTLPALDAPGL